MDRLTRKELKQDKFALEVEHTVEYVSEHRKQMIRYGTAAALVIALVIGGYAYRRYRHTARQEALTAALEVQTAPIGPAAPGSITKSYATEQDRQKAFVSSLGDVAAKFSGSDEADIATYYMGVIAANDGRLADADKLLRQVADSGGNYGSLAKLALADVLKGEGKMDEGRKLLQSLIDKPTEFVSKEAATLALGQYLAASNPAEARKLLEPLRTGRGSISRMALTYLSEIQQ